MEDVTRFVEGLISQLGKAFFFAGFLPALILVAVNQHFIFGPDYTNAEAVWNLFPEVTTPWLGLFSGPMLTAIMAAVVLGLVLISLNGFIIRLFEGLMPGAKAVLFPFYLRNLRRYRKLYEPIAAKHVERRALLARYEDTDEYEEEADYAIIDDLHRLHAEREKTDPVQALPYDRSRVTPTAYGNAWAVMEEYPLVRYGLDGMLFWPYVRESVNQQNPRLLDEIDNQKLLIDVVTHLALVMGILTLEGLIFGVVRFQWQMFVLAGVALLLFLAFYQAAVSYVRALATLVTKSYDLYRLPVLDAFGLERPHDLDDEYWVWTRLSAFLRRGEPSYFNILDRRDGDEEGT